MPKATKHCVYCPDCGKDFKNSTTLLQHANQPLGRCRSFGRRSHARVIAIATRIARQRPFTSPEPSHLPTPLTPQDAEDTNVDVDIEGSEPKSDLDAPAYLVHSFPNASQNFGCGSTFLNNFDADVYASERKSNLYYPFADSRDWEMAQWLTLSGLSMLEMDKFLSVRLVCLSPGT